MTNLDELTAQVHATVEGQAAAILAFQGLAAQFAEAAAEPGKVLALSEQLRAGTKALSDAIFTTPATTPVTDITPRGQPRAPR